MSQVLDRVGQAVVPGLLRENGEPMSLDEVRTLQVRFVMELCKGNKTAACKMLGIDRRTLYRTLDRMNGKSRPRGDIIGADDATLDAPDEPRTAFV